MERYGNWDPDEWDDWERQQEEWEEEWDEEWEDELYRSYREQYPEEFDDPDDPPRRDMDVTQSISDDMMDYINSLFRQRFYDDEPIAPRRPQEPLPKLLHAARALERGVDRIPQSRNTLFLKQAKLLEHYEDDYPQNLRVIRYYPTYESLSDQELRSYFAFRTRLRRGEDPEGCTSFFYLAVYELINGIGAATPQEGLEKLDALMKQLCYLNCTAELHRDRWRTDYLVYYDLPPALYHPAPEEEFARLDEAESLTTEQIVGILKSADSINSWLKRSKCYAIHREEFDRVLACTIQGISRRCSGKTRSLCDRYFGILRDEPIRLFPAAVFADPLKRKTAAYSFSPWHSYRLEDGVWIRRKRQITDSGIRKLTGLVKSVDNALRAQFGPKHLIQAPEQPRWINTLISESIQSLLEEQAAQRREQERLKIDYSALERIRADAAITREKLRVEEEAEEEIPEEISKNIPEEIPEPIREAMTPEVSTAGTAPDCPLNPAEYRLMQCLLYGGNTGWVQREGLIKSVLLDGINDKLYDIFQDTVAEDAGIVEDYIDELKEMIVP